ncbi:NADH dehydrogenase [ubiquinone] 1 alpha subcomplex subunit 10, mitochondrial-like [Dreissena polymorpha]|uniref:Deoxynucleoside kinase domain-containing protein n=1 Tax=Dreissena polymorpha TaxID=45954 RepID=A0A9D4CB94_DREPO|nr:NADH dehydrogenase [ubiquinone] 1 alpha subcomplex subunit 10, mitochondrial-like [Dreissena polymorpha]KAH3720314.1 hypothetical protein DPMN_063211 [Dreissena polymorpha]
MAVARAKLSPLVRNSCSLLSRHANVIAPTTVEGQRNLTAHPKYVKPYPEWLPFNFFASFLDITSKRLNDNSRMICIDGPPCVGKSAFAKQMADHFKMQHYPGYQPEDWYMRNGFDLRRLNTLIHKPKLKFLDLDDFYLNATPNKYLSSKQLEILRWRFYQYAEALRYLLSTGVGTIVETNVWSDKVYAATLAEMGYFSRKGYRYYEEYLSNILNYMMRPSLVIYLDAPTKWIITEMRKKNPKYENSPVLTEDYINRLKDNYHKLYLEPMKKHCEILEYDVTDMEDIDLVFMDLEQVDLISRQPGDQIKYANWRLDKEEDWSMFRLQISNDARLRKMCTWRPAFDVPELYMSEDDTLDLESVLSQFPELVGRDIFADQVTQVNPLTLAKGSYLDPSVK